LVVSARTSDGLIEATEKPDARFFLSVQWHPENLYDHDPAMPAIFGALVQAAACYCQDRLEAEQTA
jgi:putative glutamine amidotransferase